MHLHDVRLRLRCRSRALWSRMRRLSASDDREARRWLHRELWNLGIPDELEWWRDWLTTDDGKEWLAEVLNPERTIQDPVVARLIDEAPSDPVSIIEVGSGPITHLGYTRPGKDVRITPVDPLAREYSAILRNAGVQPPVSTVDGDGETLLEHFAPRSFDLAWASNALDHCYDPLLVIRNLVGLVRKDGFVVLRHYRNEGRDARYQGMHQWNFDARDGALIIGTEANEQDITALLGESARVEAFLEDSDTFGAFQHNQWVVSTIQRLT